MDKGGPRRKITKFNLSSNSILPPPRWGGHPIQYFFMDNVSIGECVVYVYAPVRGGDGGIAGRGV